MARDQLGISCELVDLRTIMPWDVETVAEVRIMINVYLIKYCCTVSMQDW